MLPKNLAARGQIVYRGQNVGKLNPLTGARPKEKFFPIINTNGGQQS